MNTTIIEQFPQVTQHQIRENLKFWRAVYVFRENGEYRVSTGIALSGEVNPRDFKSWHIESSEIYTDAELTAVARTMPSFN